ncbi:MAG: precorrin-2 C(20)-methyltransferase [Methanomassiliicoccaceae archaeon]|jgi:precorrin-2/cobalt-factor-2 C20-methyltransferase|nr:precorrin-2 C(20)-methyltransferase [Methanomassiliicoccaceae archaeon]
MAGKLYGIGIGPGDPGLLTLKAKEILDRTGTIVCPVKKEGEASTALEIVRKAVNISGKRIVPLVFAMEGGREQFEECGRKAGDVLMDILSKGEDAAVITLGDVSVYSTYMYLDGYVSSKGFETEIIPGVTSFSYAAALAKIPLMLGDEGLAVITPKGRSIEHALEGFENIVVMKSGKHMKEMSAAMTARGIPHENAVVVSRAGMEGQHIGVIDERREFNYFTTTIIKKVMR